MHIFTTIITLASIAITTTLAADTSANRRIIIDTDIFSDVDDVGALAIANLAHRCNYIDLAGVVVSTTSKYGALAVSAVNTYFNNSHVPIAARRPITNDTFFDSWYFRLGEFASKLAYHFPRSISTADDTPTPVALYRSILASSFPSSSPSPPQSSVVPDQPTTEPRPQQKTTLVIIGFLSNLADLLRSPPDSSSPLSGIDLVRETIAEIIIMGGVYPHGGWEFNFAGSSPSSTKFVLSTLREHTSIPITYLGYELGKSIVSGGSLRHDAPSDSPILAAYEWYVTRCKTGSASYDPLTVLYAILMMQDCRASGEGMFEFGNEGGYNQIEDDGTNVWVEDPAVTNQHWLRLKSGRTAEEVAEMLDALLAQDGGDVQCDVFEQFHHLPNSGKTEL